LCYHPSYCREGPFASLLLLPVLQTQMQQTLKLQPLQVPQSLHLGRRPHR
jgi:hypothetical protein